MTAPHKLSCAVLAHGRAAFTQSHGRRGFTEQLCAARVSAEAAWFRCVSADAGPPTSVSCPRVQDVVNTHPGLAFLKEASEFHSRYITTVSMAATAREVS